MTEPRTWKLVNGDLEGEVDVVEGPTIFPWERITVSEHPTEGAEQRDDEGLIERLREIASETTDHMTAVKLLSTASALSVQPTSPEDAKPCPECRNHNPTETPIHD